MKNIFKISIFLLAMVVITGCHKITTEGVTMITYYPTITVLGDSPAVVTVGTTYVDAGCKVELNGEDVSSIANVSSNVNANALGIYSVTYSAINSDGFSASATRTVFVVNPNSFASVYYGESNLTTNAARHYYGAPILITKRSDGNYDIDDIVGGFQFWGVNPGFEPTYDFHLEAVLKLEDDNTITLVRMGTWYWGNNTTYVSGTFDPDTQTVVMNLLYSGNLLIVTLTGVK